MPVAFAKLPHVPTHEKVNDGNTIINPETGHITGIIELTNVKMLPFGIELGGIEKFLGFMSNQG